MPLQFQCQRELWSQWRPDLALSSAFDLDHKASTCTSTSTPSLVSLGNVWRARDLQSTHLGLSLHVRTQSGCQWNVFASGPRHLRPSSKSHADGGEWRWRQWWWGQGWNRTCHLVSSTKCMNFSWAVSDSPLRLKGTLKQSPTSSRATLALASWPCPWPSRTPDWCLAASDWPSLPSFVSIAWRSWSRLLTR